MDRRDRFFDQLPTEPKLEWKFQARCHLLHELIHYVRGFDSESFSVVCRIVAELEKVSLLKVQYFINSRKNEEQFLFKRNGGNYVKQ